MEKFMQKKFATHKRYSSEGSEAITIAINTMIAEASRPEAKKELESVVLGMPHRGRLATLVVLNDYPFRNLLYKASGKNDIPKLRTFVDRLLPYWFLLLSVLLCVVIVVAGGVVPLIFSDAFRASVPVLVAISWALVARMAS